MLFGVNYRNMHTAIHGIMLFKDEQKAISAYDQLCYLYKADFPEDFSEDDAEFILENIFNTMYALIEEINYRDILPVMKNMKYFIINNGRVSPEYDDITIVNDSNVSVYGI